MRSFCILHGSVLAAKDDPGVPYTYAHTYLLTGSVLAAKGDPGVPYTYIHTYILPRISFGCKKLSGRTL